MLFRPVVSCFLRTLAHSAHDSGHAAVACCFRHWTEIEWEPHPNGTIRVWGVPTVVNWEHSNLCWRNCLSPSSGVLIFPSALAQKYSIWVLVRLNFMVVSGSSGSNIQFMAVRFFCHLYHVYKAASTTLYNFFDSHLDFILWTLMMMMLWMMQCLILCLVVKRLHVDLN